MRIARLATCTALLALVGLSACASPESSQSGPVLRGGASSAGQKLPQRPYTILIEKLEPCRSLTQGQLTQLGVGSPEPEPGTPDAGPSCQWRHSPQEPIESYFVQTTTRFGAQSALQNPLGATLIQVAGFPAVETRGMGASTDRSCQILLDVADSQTMEVAYSYNGRTLPMTRELACQKARVAAELAMQTLIQQSGG